MVIHTMEAIAEAHAAQCLYVRGVCGLSWWDLQWYAPSERWADHGVQTPTNTRQPGCEAMPCHTPRVPCGKFLLAITSHGSEDDIVTMRLLSLTRWIRSVDVNVGVDSV